MKDKSRKQTTLHNFFIDLTKEEEEDKNPTDTEININTSSIKIKDSSSCSNNESVIDLCSSDSETEVIVADKHTVVTDKRMKSRNQVKTSQSIKQGQKQYQTKVVNNNATMRRAEEIVVNKSCEEFGMTMVQGKKRQSSNITKKEENWLKSPILIEKQNTKSSSFITPSATTSSLRLQSISQTKYKALESPSITLDPLSIPEKLCCCCFRSDVDDLLVVCEKCKLWFHHSCYGIDKIPEGGFNCDLCKDDENEEKEGNKKPSDIHCQLCWRSNGAYKCAGKRVEFVGGCSRTRKLWVHVICATGLGLAYNEKTETYDISSCSDAQSQKTRNEDCVVCNQHRDSPKMSCSGIHKGTKQTCKVAVHPICLATHDCPSHIQRIYNSNGKWGIICADHMEASPNKKLSQANAKSTKSDCSGSSRKSPVKRPKQATKTTPLSTSPIKLELVPTMTAGWIAGGWMADPSKKKRQRSKTQFYQPLDEKVPSPKKNKAHTDVNIKAMSSKPDISKATKLNCDGQAAAISTSAVTTTADAVIEYKKGDLIQAQWYGETKGFEFGTCWFNGRIERKGKKKGTYCVQYVNSEGHVEEIEDNVPVSKIKKGHGKGCKCSLPVKCQVKHSSSWEQKDVSSTRKSKGTPESCTTTTSGSANKRTSHETNNFVSSSVSSVNRFFRGYKISLPRSHQERDYCLVQLYEEICRIELTVADKMFSTVSVRGRQNLMELINFFTGIEDDSRCQEIGYGYIARVLCSYGGQQLFEKYTQTMLKKLYQGMVMLPGDENYGFEDHIFRKDFSQCFLDPVQNLLRLSNPKFIATCSEITNVNDIVKSKVELKRIIEWLPNFQDISSLIVIDTKNDSSASVNRRCILALSCIVSSTDTFLHVLAAHMLQYSAIVQSQAEIIIWQELFTRALVKAYNISIDNDNYGYDDAAFLDSVFSILAGALPFIFSDMSCLLSNDSNIEGTDDLNVRIRHWNKECSSVEFLPTFTDRLTNVSTKLFYPCLLAANGALRAVMKNSTSSSLATMDTHLLKVFKEIGTRHLSRRPIVHFNPLLLDALNFNVNNERNHPMYGTSNLFYEAIQSVVTVVHV